MRFCHPYGSRLPGRTRFVCYGGARLALTLTIVHMGFDLAALVSPGQPWSALWSARKAALALTCQAGQTTFLQIQNIYKKHTYRARTCICCDKMG